MAGVWKLFTRMAERRLHQLHYFWHFLLPAASSGSNTGVALIPFILLVIWANLFSFLYFRRFDYADKAFAFHVQSPMIT
jgi:hypothetical protein